MQKLLTSKIRNKISQKYEFMFEMDLKKLFFGYKNFA